MMKSDISFEEIYEIIGEMDEVECYVTDIQIRLHKAVKKVEDRSEHYQSFSETLKRQLNDYILEMKEVRNTSEERRRQLEDQSHEIARLKTVETKLKGSIRHLERKNDELRGQITELEQDQMSETW